MIDIYTDGGCSPNPGKGGWGAIILLSNNEPLELYGNNPHTTNNRMELLAVINGLLYIHKNNLNQEKINLYTDSQYVKNGITSWVINWKTKGWKTANKKPVLNQDLWQELDKLREGLGIEWHWVKGHSGNHYNELCDKLVHKARAQL